MGQATALAAGTIITVISEVTRAINSVLSKKGTRIDKKVDAVKLMQRAINNTRNYLVNSNNNYQPNADLSNLWNDAYAAMMPIDTELARRLNDKSRFWSNPHIWIAEEGAMELIPTLKELEDNCDLIMVELEKRKK